MPVPYIIALIIGVIVVVVLAYWLVSAGGKGSNIGKEAECTARKTEYCASQTSEVWNKMSEVCGNNKFTGKTVREIEKTQPGGQKIKIPVKDCYDFCSRIIPGWKPVGDRSECSSPA